MPVKMFWPSGGSDKANRRRTGKQLTYAQVDEALFLKGLADAKVRGTPPRQTA